MKQDWRLRLARLVLALACSEIAASLGAQATAAARPIRLGWQVAGSIPMNRALSMATGTFITHLDDDDAYPGDRIAKLVKFIQETKVDLAWHPFHWEVWREKVVHKES